MSKLSLTVACGDYDRVRAIKDGRVQIEGCDVNFLPLAAEEVFFRAFRSTEFDVTELSFSSTMIQTARGDCQYIGIPAFVSRIFRHSSIYIRTDRGITRPEDLRGKKIGLPEYQMTAPVWMRGMMQDEYGVRPEECIWRSGGQDQPGREERTPIKPIPGLDLAPIPNDRTLVDMFVKGELDALFTARAPSCFVEGAPNIGRLFPNYREVEKAYYQKTKLFPIMHFIGIKKSLVEQHPWLATSVYKAFVQAKAIAMQEVRDITALNITLPWVEAEALESMALMGQDYWRYGVKESLHEIDALARYSHEQGLSSRLLTAADLFAPSVMDISRI